MSVPLPSVLAVPLAIPSQNEGWRDVDRRLKLRLVVLICPFALLPFGMVGIYSYPIILRDGNFSPVVGVPGVMYLVAPLVMAAYSSLAFRVLKSSPFLLARLRASGAGLLLLFIFSCFMLLGWAQTLNGLLDFGPLTVQRSVVIGTTLKGRTPYTVLQDW